MPKRPDPLFEIPRPAAFTEPVLDLLGGVARPRSLSGEEAIAALARIEESPVRAIRKLRRNLRGGFLPTPRMRAATVAPSFCFANPLSSIHRPGFISSRFFISGGRE